MHANVYFSVFLMEAFTGLEKIRQRVANMPKLLSITRRALESR